MNQRVLHHPKPQRPIHPLPTTSPPPTGPTIDHSESYQRFASPPAVQQQPQQQSYYQPQQSSSTAHYQYQQQPPQQPQQQFFTPGVQSTYQGGSAPSPPTWANVPSSTSGGGGGGYDSYGLINDATTQMGVQFGRHAFSAGTAYLDDHFMKHLIPSSALRHAFNVSNLYVLVKLKLLLFPWTHKGWARGVERSQVSGIAQGFKLPRDDINCPDLYIPLMALTTYILLSAVIVRPDGLFDPKVLGSSASTAFGILFAELVMVKLGCYLLAIGDDGTFIDLVAYEGYKFVGIIMTLLAGLCGAKGWLFWLIFVYAFLANFFFLLRSLRSVILPDPSASFSPLDQDNSMSSHGISPVHGAVGGGVGGGVGGVGGGGISHAQRKRRMMFLFALAAAPAPSMLLLVWM